MSSQHRDLSTSDRGRLPHHSEVPFQPPDPSTATGEKIVRRLREELFIWLITVDATGTPHTSPQGDTCGTVLEETPLQAMVV